jgi:uncharacterized protein (DUF433 family)
MFGEEIRGHVQINCADFVFRKSPPHFISSPHRRIIWFMSTPLNNLLDRITYNPQQCGGRPCIRGMRIRVTDILEMLASGVSEVQILADFPDLERDDIRACLHFAAKRSEIVRLAA